MLTAELYLIPHAAWHKIQHKYVSVYLMEFLDLVIEKTLTQNKNGMCI